ncbi:MAG TPA: cytochrome c [Rhizomicrobium sp.]|jgi:mono/diheme cytochrome c family protein
MRRLVVAFLILGLIVFGIVGWMVLGAGPLGFAKGSPVALASYTGPDPTGVPADMKNASLVERGEYLTRAADCEACHTIKGGEPFTGGLAFKLPFGTLYSPNITPDRETGIGNWSDADFLNAMHKGIAPGGTRLYPAFPYASYTMMTDTDALAIKAFLFSLPARHFTAPAGTLAFPFNQRWLMTFWSAFFNPSHRFEPNPAQSPQWNRGAYLAEAMAHCGECHTPRNLMQAMDHRRKFSGAVASGWKAYNITQDKDSGIGGWSEASLNSFLSSGHASGYGTASGPMGEAVDKSLMYLEASDIAALVTYLRSVPAISDPALPAPRTAPAPASPKEGTVAGNTRGKAIFAGACASCHDWTGTSPILSYATFTGGRAVNDPSARNVVQAIVSGVTRESADGPVDMPAFGHAYSDIEIAAVANYVTARFGAAPSSVTAKQVADIRKQAP